MHHNKLLDVWLPGRGRCLNEGLCLGPEFRGRDLFSAAVLAIVRIPRLRMRAQPSHGEVSWPCVDEYLRTEVCDAMARKESSTGARV